MGKKKDPSFSRHVGKKCSLRNSNITVSSKADSEVETVITQFSACDGNEIASRSSSSSNVRQRKLDYELAVKESSRIYNERISTCKE